MCNPKFPLLSHFLTVASSAAYPSTTMASLCTSSPPTLLPIHTHHTPLLKIKHTYYNLSIP
jgi:hypothetical protein